MGAKVCLAACVAILAIPDLGIALSDKEVFEQKCSRCHSLERVLSKQKTAKGWQEKIARMAAKTHNAEWMLDPGQITQSDVERVVRYLVSVRLEEKPAEYSRGTKTKDKFEVPDEIQRAANPDRLAGLERFHVPIIELPPKIFAAKSFEVNVRVSQTSHPMVPEHHLMYISLYKGDELVGKVDLKLEDRPKTSFNITISEDTPLRAVVECTSHRLWESTTTAKVMFY